MSGIKLGITLAALAWFAAWIFGGIELVAHTGGRGYEIPTAGVFTGCMLGGISLAIPCLVIEGLQEWWKWMSKR